MGAIYSGLKVIACKLKVEDFSRMLIAIVIVIIVCIHQLVSFFFGLGHAHIDTIIFSIIHHWSRIAIVAPALAMWFKYNLEKWSN